MASNDFKKVMHKIHNQKKKIEKIDIRLGNQEHIKLQFDDKTEIESTEHDVADYATSLKRGLDKDGDYVFREVKDLNKYFENEYFLFHDHDQKIADASHDFANGKFKFSYDVDKLQEEFLLSTDRRDPKYEPLKKDYFHIAAYRTNGAAMLLKLHEKHLKDSPEYKEYFLAVTTILSKAFRQDKNFIKNFANKNEKAKLNLLGSLNKYVSVLEHSKDMQKIFNPHGIEADAGTNLILDTCRRYTEASIEPLNFLRIAHELNQGEASPDNVKSASENKRILSTVLGSKLDCFDPDLRNSESHLDTVIDRKNHKVILTDEGGQQKEYSYTEIADLANCLMHNLLPALMIGLVMESQVVMLILSSRSTEYITALLGIDNT